MCIYIQIYNKSFHKFSNKIRPKSHGNLFLSFQYLYFIKNIRVLH